MRLRSRLSAAVEVAARAGAKPQSERCEGPAKTRIDNRRWRFGFGIIGQRVWLA
jgi:hypothetical protein